MPVQHIIAIKFKPDVTEEQIIALGQGLKTLTQIDGVLSVECGKDFTQRADFNYVMVVIMRDRDTLERYGPHPVHIRVKDEIIAPLRENIIALDFDI